MRNYLILNPNGIISLEGFNDLDGEIYFVFDISGIKIFKKEPVSSPSYFIAIAGRKINDKKLYRALKKRGYTENNKHEYIAIPASGYIETEPHRSPLYGSEPQDWEPELYN